MGLQQVTSTKPSNRRQVFLVFAGVCIFNFIGYGIIINCFGMFLAPVSQAMGISVTNISMTHTIRTLCGMGTTLIAGHLMPKCNLRRYLAVVCLGLAFSSFLTAHATLLWQFALCAALLGSFAGLGIYTLVPLVINQWFERSGSYIGIATACGGLGGVVFSPVLAWIIEDFGWQGGYYCITIVVLLGMLPAALFLIRFSPHDVGCEPWKGKCIDSTSTTPSATPLGVGVTLRDARKLPAFYFIIIFFVFVSMVSGAYTHVPSIMETKGFQSLQVGVLNSCYQCGGAIAQLLLGVLSARWGLKRTMSLFLLLISCGLFGLVMASSENYLLAAVAILLFGGGRALGVVVGPILVREAFGQRHYSQIFSSVYTVYLTMCAAATTIYGMFYDHTESYDAVFVLIFGCILFVALACFSTIYHINRSAWRLDSLPQSPSTSFGRG